MLGSLFVTSFFYSLNKNWFIYGKEKEAERSNHVWYGKSGRDTFIIHNFDTVRYEAGLVT